MEEKRTEILERASVVFMKNGIRSVTMSDLAKELGISKKTIYKYFEDKNDLIYSIIELKIEMDKALCTNCSSQAHNAIEDLYALSKFIVEQIGNVNPNVFYDLKKYHSEAWQIINTHKWDFVLSMILKNIQRGKKEGLYRKEMDEQIISRLYIGATELIVSGGVFPWPDFKFEHLFSEMIHFHIKGMINEKGEQYLKQRIENENK